MALIFKIFAIVSLKKKKMTANHKIFPFHLWRYFVLKKRKMKLFTQHLIEKNEKETNNLNRKNGLWHFLDIQTEKT